MTRQQFEKVVLVGLRRSQGGTPQQQAGAISDAMELAMDLDSPMPTPAQTPNVVPVIKPVVDDRPIEWPIMDPVKAVGPDGASLNQPNQSAEPPIDLRHIGPPTTITLETLVQALNERTPPFIDVTFQHPEKGRVQYILERNVISDPLAKSAALMYKHPQAPDQLTASVVFTVDDGLPDIATGVAKAREIAAKLYTPRETMTPVPVRDVPSESAFLSPQFGNLEVLPADRSAPDMGSISGLGFKEPFSFKQ